MLTEVNTYASSPAWHLCSKMLTVIVDSTTMNESVGVFTGALGYFLLMIMKNSLEKNSEAMGKALKKTSEQVRGFRNRLHV